MDIRLLLLSSRAAWDSTTGAAVSDLCPPTDSRLLGGSIGCNGGDIPDILRLVGDATDDVGRLLRFGDWSIISISLVGEVMAEGLP